MPFYNASIRLKEKNKMENEFMPEVYGEKALKKELKSIHERYMDETLDEKKKAFLPRGIIFTGRPGTGKTYIAKKYAKAFNCHVFVLSGEEGYENLNKTVEETYALARKEKMAIVIIDELDTFVDKDEKLQRILQACLDGYSSRDEGRVLTLATCNSLREIPAALQRKGRFDRQFYMHASESDRISLWDNMAKEVGLKLTKEDIKLLADYCDNDTPAEIMSYLGDAYFRYGEEATVDNVLKVRNLLDHDDVYYLEEAEKTRWNIAIHEAGHAVYALKFANKIDVLRILAGEDSGKTFTNVKETQEINVFVQSVKVHLAGMAAEDIFFKRKSLGATSDLEKAYRSLDHLLHEACMHSIKDYLDVELRNQYGSTVEFGKRNNDVVKLMNRYYKQVKKCLKKERHAISKVASALMEKRSLNKEEIISLIENGEIVHIPNKANDLFPKKNLGIVLNRME